MKNEDKRRSTEFSATHGGPQDLVKPALTHSALAQSQEIQALLQPSSSGLESMTVAEHASNGVRGANDKLPHQERIQSAFGPFDVSNVQARIGGRAEEANASLGAVAYTTQEKVAFSKNPDLHTSAHEAAHVIQQRAGVSLNGNVGRAGDPYERHADAVADRVVRGEPATDLLSHSPAKGGAHAALQKKDEGEKPLPMWTLTLTMDRQRKAALNTKFTFLTTQLSKTTDRQTAVHLLEQLTKTSELIVAYQAVINLMTKYPILGVRGPAGSPAGSLNFKTVKEVHQYLLKFEKEMQVGCTKSRQLMLNRLTKAVRKNDTAQVMDLTDGIQKMTKQLNEATTSVHSLKLILKDQG